jgi:hypothetical protein
VRTRATFRIEVARVTLLPAIMVGFTCGCCGAFHEELPLCFLDPSPVYADQVDEAERPRRVRLSSDQCIVDDEHFFILGNLDVPILGRSESVRWSVWSTLSQKNFERACDLWETAGREAEPPYFGWLSSPVPGYDDTINLKLSVHTLPVGTRPRLEVLEQDHPLYRDHVHGVTWERACELSHAAMPHGEQA